MFGLTENSFLTVDSANPDSGFKRADVVRMYKEDTKLTFPCVVLTCETLEKFRVDALKGILGHRSLVSNEDQYAVYIHMQNQLVEIGVLPSTKLKFLLGNKVFDVFSKRVHLDAESVLEGEMLYALCMTSSAM